MYRVKRDKIMKYIEEMPLIHSSIIWGKLKGYVGMYGYLGMGFHSANANRKEIMSRVSLGNTRSVFSMYLRNLTIVIGDYGYALVWKRKRDEELVLYELDGRYGQLFMDLVIGMEEV